MHNPVRVTVWNEGRHEKRDPKVASIYPDGIHEAIAAGLRQAGFEVRTATQDEPEHGLTDAVLQETDVLTWWGHAAHQEVQDGVVDKVFKRVMSGMGLIVLHASMGSKIFIRLMGSSCKIKWRDAGEKERLWVIEPGHPISAGLEDYFEIPYEEMYGERFDVPAPDNLVFISWFPGGEVFRSGCCYYRGSGKVFYFRPGHETYPTYYQSEVRSVIANAVQWAAPSGARNPTFGNYPPLEPI